VALSLVTAWVCGVAFQCVVRTIITFKASCARIYANVNVTVLFFYISFHYLDFRPKHLFGPLSLFWGSYWFFIKKMMQIDPLVCLIGTTLDLSM
jgi:hypothetical protein